MSPVTLVEAPKSKRVRKPKAEIKLHQRLFSWVFDDKETLHKRPVNGVVQMVREAFARKNLLATVIGGVLGSFVPVATYVLAHYEVLGDWWKAPKAVLVCGGLIYSARTMLKWAYMAFRDALKAVGFTLILEGVMTFSVIPSLALIALGLLVFVNATAAGVTLARS